MQNCFFLEHLHNISNSHQAKHLHKYLPFEPVSHPFCANSFVYFNSQCFVLSWITNRKLNWVAVRSCVGFWIASVCLLFSVVLQRLEEDCPAMPHACSCSQDSKGPPGPTGPPVKSYYCLYLPSQGIGCPFNTPFNTIQNNPRQKTTLRDIISPESCQAGRKRDSRGRQKEIQTRYLPPTKSHFGETFPVWGGSMSLSTVDVSPPQVDIVRGRTPTEWESSYILLRGREREGEREG